MKRMFTVVALATAAVSASAAEWVVTTEHQQTRRADVEGTWSARVRTSEKPDGVRVPQLQLQMNIDDDRGRDNWSNWGQSVPLAAFSSLPADLERPQDVKFELRRDAGVVTFEGRFESGRGVGHLFFTANREFEQAMEQQTRETFTDRELLSFALIDVSRAFVKELQSLGFNQVTLEDARKLRIHGTTPDFIRGIRSAGYPSVTLDDVLKLRIHGVSPTYISSLKAEGLQNPSLDEVLKFRIHGITTTYVKEMRAAGLGTDLDDLLQLRIHGVTPEYVKEMRSLSGGRPLDASDIRQLRIHGVTPAFAKEMAALGYKLDFDDLRTFRIHGVTASYVREMAALGYKNVDADTLVKFRIHGVTPSFVKKLKDAGYTNLSADEIVDWAIHGRRLLKYKRR